MKEHKVYHIHVIGNSDLKQGYIGVTSRLKQRTAQHVCSGMLKDNDVLTVLCAGSEEYCYALEMALRPTSGIGRNISNGGKVGCACYKKGERPSRDTEIVAGQHLSPKTEFKKGQTPHNKGNGLDYVFTDPNGKEYFVECITDFCRAHDLTPQNMRKVAKGQRNFHKGWKAIHAGRQE